MSQCRILKKKKKRNTWSSNTIMSWTRTWRKLHGRKNWVPRAIFACVPSHKLNRPKGGRSYFLQIPVSYSSTHKYVFCAKKVPIFLNQIPKSPVHEYAISSFFSTFRLHRSVAYNKREELSGSFSLAKTHLKTHRLSLNTTGTNLRMESFGVTS